MNCSYISGSPSPWSIIPSVNIAEASSIICLKSSKSNFRLRNSSRCLTDGVCTQQCWHLVLQRWKGSKTIVCGPIKTCSQIMPKSLNKSFSLPGSTLACKPTVLRISINCSSSKDMLIFSESICFLMLST